MTLLQHKYEAALSTGSILTNKFELDEIAYENYVGINGQKPIRVTMYKAGKYIGGK
jgi:hypothetical protein